MSTEIVTINNEINHQLSKLSDKNLNEEEERAFQVINQDNLKMPVLNGLAGEPLLKQPFNLHKLNKPNGIVLPQRRIANNINNNNSSNYINNNLEHQKQFAKSNGSINVISEKHILRKTMLSNSHGHLNHQNSSVRIRIEDLEKHGLDRNFTKTLDAKLRKLQKETNGSNTQSVVSSARRMDAKPRFVTTVKKGEFLEPPPEIASLLGLSPKAADEKVAKESDNKKLYAFASQPRVLDRNVETVNVGTAAKFGHKARCDAAAKAAAKNLQAIDEVVITKREVTPALTHIKNLGDVPLPYQNLMFDRRVVRGSTYAINPPHAEKWNPNFAYARSLSRGDGESAAARAAEARRRAMARKKAQSQQLRGAQLRLGSPPPVQGRRHEKLQTESYLEELVANPQMADTNTQTDLSLDRPDSPIFVPAYIGIDAETQIWPGDLFDFDMEVQPILEVLVGKTIEQALIEVLEEEELAALREQQRRFLETHASEMAESMRLHELERLLQLEKERRLVEYEEGMRVQKEMEERIAGAVLMQGYMADLLPSVLEGLEDEGFLTDSIKQNIDDSFIPWLMKEVTSELKEMVGSRDLLTEIVREILENRAEIYRALNEERTESEDEGTVGQDIPLVEHLKLKDEIQQNQEIEEKLETFLEQK